MFFYEWVERCETGKAWDLLCKKKCSLKVHSAVTPLFFVVVGWLGFFCCCYCFSFSFVFKFYFFLPSQTWMLGFSLSRLQKFCALFFVCWLRSFFFFFLFFLCAHLFFSKKILDFFFFLKSPILEFACWDSLESFFPLILLLFFLFLLLFFFEETAFSSKFSSIKGEPAQFRFHSSEFSVSIMHSSLLS